MDDSQELLIQESAALRRQTENILSLTEAEDDPQGENSSMVTPNNPSKVSKELESSVKDKEQKLAESDRQQKTRDVKTASKDGKDQKGEIPETSLDRRTTSEMTDLSSVVPGPPELHTNVATDLVENAEMEGSGGVRTSYPGAEAVPGINGNPNGQRTSLLSTLTPTTEQANGRNEETQHARTESGALVAMAVTRDDLEEEVRRQFMSQVVVAEEVVAESQSGQETAGIADTTQESASRGSTANANKAGELNATDQKLQRRRMILWGIVFLVLVGAVTGLLVGLLGDSSNGDNSDSEALQPPTTEDPSEDKPNGEDDNNTPIQQGDPVERLRSMLETEAQDRLGNPATALTIENSPQSKAFQWLVDNNYGNGVGEKEYNDFVTQTYFMVSLYYATNGDEWTRNDNWLNADVVICDWYPGGLCDKDNAQVVLDRARGNARNRDLLGETQNLRQHSRARGQRRLQIPAEIELVILPNNNLVGTLPDEIGFMKEVEVLELSDNPLLTGTFPASFAKLRKMDELLMNSVGLTGSFPAGLRGMEQIKTFSMSNVPGMGGEFPSDLWLIPNIERLDLSGMGLTGSLPTEGLANPSKVYLANNNIGGMIPVPILTDWLQLEELDLRNNQLSGTIPDQLASAFGGSLVSLQLEGNPLSGTVGPTVCAAFIALSPSLGQVFSSDCKNETLQCECCTSCCLDGEDCE